MPTATLAADALALSFIVDMAKVLLASAVVAMLMQRMRLAVIPGYLITGAILGPSAYKLVQSPESLEAISQLAIILLMFGIGLQLHLSVLKHNWARMVAAGAGSCTLSVLIGWPVATAFGLHPAAALAVAMALSLSSTAVVLRIIAERRELHHTSGRLALSILVTQDMIVLVMLATLPALARWSGTGGEFILPGDFDVENPASWVDFALDAGVRIGGIAAIVLVGRLLLPRILHESARGRSTEVLMIVSVAIAISAALATHLLGFSLELGAFLAGFLLSGTLFRHHLMGQIGPIRDLFIAVFFTALGMRLNPAVLVEWWWLVLIGGAVMSTLKALVIGGTLWTLGATATLAISVGLALAQAGEFSLILLGAAADQGILVDATVDNAIAIVVVSLVLTPALVWMGRRAGRLVMWIPPAPWFRRSVLEQDPAHDGEGGGHGRADGRHVIIAGYGPIGRLVDESLCKAGFRTTVIELNPVTVRWESQKGRRIIFGDASNEEVLRAAGIERSDALVLTIPDEESALHASAAAKRLAPKIFIAARTSTAGRGRMAQALGVDHVVAEEDAAASAMEAMIFDRFGRGQKQCDG